ncbi:MAG: lipid II flippase MurJ, partial [Thiohalobacterales bacterium]|nr:lipid II flippase MurJ [Thiohalobacterales bacterium]
VVALFTNMALNLSFVVPMVMFGVTGPHAGLALATSIAAWVNAGLLYRALRRRDIFMPRPGWPRLLLQTGSAALLLALLLAWAVPAIGDWLAWSAGERVTQLLLWVVAGVVTYFLTLRITGLRLLALWRHERDA